MLVNIIIINSNTYVYNYINIVLPSVLLVIESFCIDNNYRSLIQNGMLLK